jgi:hypothetical protein
MEVQLWEQGHIGAVKSRGDHCCLEQPSVLLLLRDIYIHYLAKLCRAHQDGNHIALRHARYRKASQALNSIQPKTPGRIGSQVGVDA